MKQKSNEIIIKSIFKPEKFRNEEVANYIIPLLKKSVDVNKGASLVFELVEEAIEHRLGIRQNSKGLNEEEIIKLVYKVLEKKDTNQVTEEKKNEKDEQDENIKTKLKNWL